MDRIKKLAIKYFQAPVDALWTWGADGEVLEWYSAFVDNITLCYREELIAILTELADDGIPPLGSLLLLIAATHDFPSDNIQDKFNIEEEITFTIDDVIVDDTGAYLTDEEAGKLLELSNKVIHCFQLVADLDDSFKKGKNKIHLFKELIKNTETKILDKEAQQIIQLFETGVLDEIVFDGGELITLNQLTIDLETMVEMITPFENTENLELKLKTSLEEIPDIIEVDIPEENETGDVLEQLSNDHKTSGIANLTKRLIAGLNIPMHTSGTSDQTFGGISDITNRGTFDKLLLSELANDNEALTARLVNNEALYYQHEEPPAQKNMERNIYVDATLKMWGLPRVFAVSAALATTISKKENIAINAYALLGDKTEELDLNSKKGVVESLSILDTQLDCCKGLMNVLNDVEKNVDSEHFLITHEETMHHYTFISNVQEIQHKLNYLIVVNRTGELNFYQFTNGRKKLLNTTRYDLEELLKGKKKKIPKKVEKRYAYLPAYFSEEKAPLYFPTVDMKFQMGEDLNYLELFDAEEKRIGIIGITREQRLLYWTNKEKGAIELIPYIASGKYSFGQDEDGNIFIVVNELDIGMSKLYSANIKTLEWELTEFEPIVDRIKNVVFAAQFDSDGIVHNFIVKTKRHIYYIDCELKKRLDEFRLPRNISIGRDKSNALSYNQLKKIINPGYNTFKRVEEVFINKWGELSFGNKTLLYLDNNRRMIIGAKDDQEKIELAETKYEDISVDFNPSVNLRKFTFDEGSEVYIDSRGLIHLISSDASLPELTITFVEGESVGIWASNGEISSPSYFGGKRLYEQDEDWAFYQAYIEGFTRHIADLENTNYESCFRR